MYIYVTGSSLLVLHGQVAFVYTAFILYNYACTCPAMCDDETLMMSYG